MGFELITRITVASMVSKVKHGVKLVLKEELGHSNYAYDCVVHCTIGRWLAKH